MGAIKTNTDRVFIIHGLGGEPNGGWRPWLMGELAKRGIYAAALPMPTPDRPKQQEWVEEIARQVDRWSGDRVFLVGHSLGVVAILRYLEQLPTDQKIAGAVLAAGPVESHDNPTVEDFFGAPLNLGAIRPKSGAFAVIHGTADPIVPFVHAERLAAGLEAPLIPVEGAEHLNGGSGCYQLPECLKALEKMMRE